MREQLERRRVLPLGRRPRLSDRLVSRAGFVPIWCLLCGRPSIAVRFSENLRDSGDCLRCRATNRQRQQAWVLVQRLIPGPVPRKGLSAVSGLPTRIFNAEAAGPIHRALAGVGGYVCSEYVGAEQRPGDSVGGTRHEDLQELSFSDSSFDMVVSSDVLEHVPDPYRAHREIFRVLVPGGVHVFTVPFLDSDELDQERSRLNADGTVVHVLEPQYHTDPLRPGGALVYRLFGLEMFVRLGEMGFRTKAYNVHSPLHGVYGPNAFVFVAEKPNG